MTFGRHIDRPDESGLCGQVSALCSPDLQMLQECTYLHALKLHRPTLKRRHTSDVVLVDAAPSREAAAVDEDDEDALLDDDDEVEGPD